VLEALRHTETSCTLHAANFLVVIREALDQFGVKRLRFDLVKFSAYRLFVLKCSSIGGLGVIEGDSVYDEGMDIACCLRLGSNHWRGLVVCRFDSRKRTIDEGRDCEVLAWVDFKGHHGLAPGQDRE
jgi:hypothetical protein